jgi:hypothetical protein
MRVEKAEGLLDEFGIDRHRLAPPSERSLETGRLAARTQITLPSAAAAGILFFLKSGFWASRNFRRSMARVSWGLSSRLVKKQLGLPLAVTLKPMCAGWSLSLVRNRIDSVSSSRCQGLAPQPAQPLPSC